MIYLNIYLEPDRCRLTLLGFLPSTWNASTDTENRRLRAIILIERNAFASEHVASFFNDLVYKAELIGSTDIVRCRYKSSVSRFDGSLSEQYSWFAAWISSQASEIKQPQGDVKINVICPATDVHIRKVRATACSRSCILTDNPCMQYTKQGSILVQETPELYHRIIEPYIASFPPERTRW